MKSEGMESLKIVAVGDIIFADQPLCFGFGVRSRYSNGSLDEIISGFIHDL